MAIYKYQPPINVISGVAGEALNQYDVCYLNYSDNKFYKAFCNGNEYQADACAMAIENISISTSGKLALGRSKIYNSGWAYTGGVNVYLSATPGAITNVKPMTTSHYIKPLGMFTDVGMLSFEPEIGFIVTNPTILPSLDVVGGRLDLVSATSIKWGFQNSNQIRLYDGNTWQIIQCATEPTLANTAAGDLGTGAVALAVDKIYDVFAEYVSATSFTLICSPWAVATAGASTRTAAWVGITDYKVGQRVSNSSHYYVCKTAHTSHTDTFANDSAYWVDNGLAASVGSNSDYYGLYQQDGVLVSGSDTNGKKRRWLGVIYTFNNTVVNFKNDVNYRYISNFYNSVSKTVRTSGDANTYTNVSATFIADPGIIPAKFVSCITKNLGINAFATMKSDGTHSCFLGIGVNSSTVATAESKSTSFSLEVVCYCYASVDFYGYNYFSDLEHTDAGTLTINAYLGTQSGAMALIGV
jgi:hypothetical protein